MTWYYIDESITDGDRRKGPYTIEDIRELVKDKKIREETLVWHSGMETFSPWKELEESRDPDVLPEEELLKQTIETIISDKRNNKIYAGFLPRAIAFFLDNLIIGVVGFLILQILAVTRLVDLSAVTQAAEALQTAENSSTVQMLETFMSDPSMEILIIAVSIFQALYFIIFTAIKGATPGKMALHLQVETADGKKASWATSVIRYVASIFTQFTLALYGIGYIIVLFDPKRRALHDHIAQSRVVINLNVKSKESSKKEQE